MRQATSLFSGTLTTKPPTIIPPPPKTFVTGKPMSFLPKQSRKHQPAKGSGRKVQLPYSDLGSINASVFRFGTAHPGTNLKRIAATSEREGVFGIYPTSEQIRKPGKKRWF
jgi:hypothetical protein